MAVAQSPASTNQRDAVKELMTEATLAALNAGLADRGIGAERIITILQVPGQTIANPTPTQFRVLYRAD